MCHLGLAASQAHLRMGVRGVVVDDAVDVQLGRHRLIDGAQERHELLMPVARLALGEHRAVENIERCEQRRRPVADIVMRHAFDVAQPQGQHRLSPLERLALALLVHTEHERVVGRAQIQAHDIDEASR